MGREVIEFLDDLPGGFMARFLSIERRNVAVFTGQGAAAGKLDAAKRRYLRTSIRW